MIFKNVHFVLSKELLFSSQYNAFPQIANAQIELLTSKLAEKIIRLNKLVKRSNILKYLQMCRIVFNHVKCRVVKEYVDKSILDNL